MPRGAQGQKRPADAFGLAVTVAGIATGEVEDTGEAAPKAAVPRSQSGKHGGAARREKARRDGSDPVVQGDRAGAFAA
jgi:hypothetical protein